MMKAKGIFRGLLMAALVAVVFGCEKDEKSTPTISWSNPADIQYGVALSEEQLNATASVEGTFSYTPRIGTVLEAGTEHELTVNFIPEDKGSYKEVSASVLINVLPGEPEIAWENPANIVYKTALGETELNASANIAGTFAYTPELGTVLKAGNEQELKVAFTPEDTGNYQVISKTVVINVLKQDPIITWEQPMDMFYYMNAPEPITEKQLNATANIEGEINYVGLTPGGTVLLPGKRELQVQFVPTDTDNYNTVTKSVTVHVLKSEGYVTDIEGNKYHTVQIGEQVWMAENLRATKFNDGEEIELSLSYDRTVTPLYSWSPGEVLDEFLPYDEKAGMKYNYYAIEKKKLCPTGWHLPSVEEWDILIEYLINNDCVEGEIYNDGNPNVSKALASGNWSKTATESENTPGTTDFPHLMNKSGFTAYPSHIHWDYGGVYDEADLVENDRWWSSTESDRHHAYEYFIRAYLSCLKKEANGKALKRSVRCIKD